MINDSRANFSKMTEDLKNALWQYLNKHSTFRELLAYTKAKGFMLLANYPKKPSSDGLRLWIQNKTTNIEIFTQTPGWRVVTKSRVDYQIIEEQTWEKTK